jgi:anti-sigma B factor antagonist
VLRLRGEFDVANAERLGAALNQIAARRPRRVVIDLGELDFIDASAVAQIAAARRRLPAQQCPIVLRRPRPIVRKLIELIGLDGPCVIDDDV